MSQSITLSEDWNAQDYSNLITISAAAISSVLLVIFKSRCTEIDFCCGLWKCFRDPMDISDDEADKKKKEKDKEKLIPQKMQPEPEPEPEDAFAGDEEIIRMEIQEELDAEEQALKK
jgi:hypothetical protein